MKKRDGFLLFAAVCTVLFFFAGCTCCATVQERKGFSPEILLGNCILESMKNGDYEEFYRCAGPEMGSRVTQERFIASEKELKKKYGTMESFHHVSAFETPTVGNNLWKVRFLRKGRNGKTVRQELMFRLITGYDGNQLKVVSFGFL